MNREIYLKIGKKEGGDVVLGLKLYADFNPRSNYTLSEDEIKTHKVREGNNVWKNPKLRLEELPKPEIRCEDEVLIKVKASGICGSDLHMVETDGDGYILYPGLTRFPVILGHEFAGIVEEVGSSVKNVKPGDLVTSEEMLWCGICTVCRSGDFDHCLKLNDPAEINYGELGFTIDGSHAEYVKVKEKYVWSINAIRSALRSDESALELGSLVEPTSVSYRAIFIRGGGFKPGAYVTVWGAGPIGLAAIALAKSAGATKVIALEISSVRKNLAKLVGADHVLDPVELEKKNVEPYEKILELTSGEGVDVHVEAAGAPHELLPQMLRSLSIGGKIIQIGRAPLPVEVYLENLQVKKAQIIGSQGHSSGTFGNVIRLMASGKINVLRRIITSRYRLSQGLDAFERGSKRIDGKILIKP